MSRNKYPEETINIILNAAQKLFLEKGYENTSIQDIINELGGLSKGAIYHHFKSKEDILNAVGDKFNEIIIVDLKKVRDAQNISGYEKLKKMFEISLSTSTSDRDIMFTVAPNMMENPRLLVLQFQEIFNVVAPKFIQPVIEQGVQDGSIQTEYPKELAETICLLANIWLNPMIEADIETLTNRVRFFNIMLKGMGIDLLDEQMIDSYIHYCKRFYTKSM